MSYDLVKVENAVKNIQTALTLLSASHLVLPRCILLKSFAQRLMKSLQRSAKTLVVTMIPEAG